MVILGKGKVGYLDGIITHPKSVYPSFFNWDA